MWTLSSFDLFTLGMTIKGAWVYADALDVERMRKSLLVLSEMYPHLSGRYCEKEKSLIYDTSVPLQLEEIDMKEYTATDLCGNGRLAWSLVKEYDIKGFKKGQTGPFSATIGRLKEGSILYVQCAHATMNGHSFYELIRQWGIAL